MIPPRNVLLVRLSHLGDVVQTLPLFHALREAWPEARIGWAVQTEFAQLVAGLSALTRVLPFERRGGAGAWAALRREIAAFGGAHGIDLVVDAQGNWKSAGVVALAGAARSVGYAPADRRERTSALLTAEWSPPAARGTHALERALGLAAHLLARPLAELVAEARLDVDLTASELAEGRAQLSALCPGGPPLLLHLGRPGDPRTWPAEHMRELARSGADAGWSVAVISGPAEADLGAQLQRDLSAEPRIRHWVAQRGPRAFAAVCAAAPPTARFVGADSAPLHLAASSGLVCLLLAGPQDPKRTGPWPPSRHGSMTAQPAPPCQPCLARACRHTNGPVCLSGLAPRAVLAELDAIRASRRAR
ncbi:MAG: hypothetical protein GC161_00450 [Planctomycetaceae bacterium]|nr:hypothetical protein [Planctomycetaceae bacterium]